MSKDPYGYSSEYDSDYNWWLEQGLDLESYESWENREHLYPPREKTGIKLVKRENEND